MTAPRHAVLDLDGTLLPGVLGVRYLTDLIADGNCDEAEALLCLGAIDRYAAAEGPRSPLMAEAYHHYARAVRGLTPEQARSTAARTWKTCRRELFPFAEDLVKLFGSHGYRVHLISGNSDFAIQEAVGDLGLTSGRGAVSEVVDGYITDRLTCAPGMPGGKDAVLREWTASGEFTRHGAVGIGNAASDAEVFAHVAIAIAFEPEAELREHSPLIRHVADRTTVLSLCAKLLDDARSSF